MEEGGREGKEGREREKRKAGGGETKGMKERGREG